MNTAFEPVMAALFAHLIGAATLSFTANATGDSAVLTSVSGFTGLFAGLPVFGPDLPSAAVIQSLNPGAGTVTLTTPVAANAVGAAFTTGFLTTGRRVLHWNQVSDQPALFLRRTGVTDESDHSNFFGMTTLECEAWIYCNAGQDPDADPDAALTALERMVRDSFVPDTDYGDPRFTLAETVHWCRIEGKSDISPGDQGPQAIARIPIRVTLP